MRYHDHHLHPLGYAQLVAGLDLFTAGDIPEVLARVAAHAEGVDGLVIGQRLNDEGLAERRLPTRVDLDQAVPDRPLLLYRYCGHIAVVNSAALTAAAVSEATPDPPGGRFDRDGDGRPTGVLRETALGVVTEALAGLVRPPSDTELVGAFRRLAAMGIGSLTGIVSVGEPIWCGVGDELGTLLRLAPELPVDVEVLVIADTPARLADAARQIGQTEGRVRFLGWKGFSDGSFGGHTAAMHQPYSDRPDTRGIDRLKPETALPLAREALRLGGVVAVHAIGDRANDNVLDMFQVLVGEGADPSRLRIEHASILTPAAMERMASLGITASVQPAFLATEQTWLAKRLDEERMGRVYPFRSLIEAGVRLVGGSDSPVEDPDPAIGIAAAVNRHGINPTEALTPQQAEDLFAGP